MPKKATPKTDPKPLKLRGWLVCKDCHANVEFHSLGSATKDGGWPLHRCGYDIRPFSLWTKCNPNQDTCTYVPKTEDDSGDQAQDQDS